MTVETVETVVAAAPYAALIGHKLRPLLSDSQSALADCEEDVIQICHLLSRNGKLSLVRLTKSFPTIPNLRGITNANQNDERFKMWSVMLLCTIGLTTLRAPRVSINNLRLPHQTPNPLANEFLLDVSLWNPSLINQAPSPVL